MTDREIVDKAKVFMDSEVTTVRKMRDWEFFKNNEDFRQHKKTKQAEIVGICMFAQDLVENCEDELIAYANKCREEIENL